MARVLVIEDDAAINDVVTTRLTRDGHAVTQAFSGSEARLLLGRCRREGRGLRRRHLRPHASGRDGGGARGAHSRARRGDSRDRDLRAHCRRGQDRPAAPRRRRLPHQALRPRRAGRARGGAAAAPRDGDPARRGSALAALDTRPRGAHACGGSRRGRREGRLGLAHQDRVQHPRGARPSSPTACSQSRSSSSWHGASPSPGDDSTVAVHVSNIRAKLRETGTDDYVQTVWGMGFKLA